MRGNAKVSQTPAFLLLCSPVPLREAKGPLCFLLMTRSLWGMFCRVTILTATSGQQPWEITSSHRRGTWHMGLPWLQTWLWDMQDVRHAVTLQKEPWAKQALESIALVTRAHWDRPALAGTQKMKASRKKCHWQPRAAAGREQPPHHCAFSMAWFGRMDTEPSFLVNYQNIAAPLLCFLFHLFLFSHLTSLWFFSSMHAYSIQLALDTAPRPQIPVVIIPSTFHKSMDISPKALAKFQLS